MPTLPSRHDAWLAPFVPVVPEERLATCNACPKCAPPAAPVEGRPFRPDTKCCTYHPTLANFAVGAILRDPAALARDRIVARMENGAGVGPLGVTAPPPYELLYGRAPFGRTRAMMCPWYIEPDGLCGVWAHREAVCSTWFCIHEGGEADARWWVAVKRYLEWIEEDLAYWCMLQLDPGPAVRAHLGATPPPSGPLSPNDFGEPLTEAERVERWGAWAGREAAFFEACDDLVAPLGVDEVLARCGPRTRLAAANLRDAEQARRAR